MKHFFCYMTMLGILLLAIQAKAQIEQRLPDSLTDDDIITIKTMAERQLSDYQDVMNRLIEPDLLNIVRVSIVKDGMALFTENARIEVDYDTTYFPPNLTYEVEIQKYLGDFATYHEQMNQVIYTDRIISDIKWKNPENFYYLTINFTSIYDDLPPQRRVATFKARREGKQWQTRITYIKFKTSPGSPLAFIDAQEDAPTEDTTAIQTVPTNRLSIVQEKAEAQNQVFLNNLSSGGRRGKRYLVGWHLPQDDAVSVQLLNQGDVVKTIITEQEANLLQWTIDAATKPGKYRLKVVNERNMTSVTSPAFTISRRFPMALRIGMGVAAGFYIVQAARNDWNFGWPFGGGETPEVPPGEFPELPEPPGLPE